MRSRLGLALAAVWLLIATAGGVAADTLERIKQRGTIIVAAIPDTLPQAARDSSGALSGFDIEVAEELAKRMGLDISFETPTWQQVLAGDWKKRWDICVCSMTPTEDREKKLAFPAVYRMSAATLVVGKDNTTIGQPSDASGKTIGVKADTTFESYLAHDLTIYKSEDDITYLIDNPNIVTYPDKNSALAALASGEDKLDAVVTSLAHAKGTISKGSPVRVIEQFLFFEPLAITTEKGEQALGEAIRAAVESLEEDGTLSQLSEKWFGIDLTSQ